MSETLRQGLGLTRTIRGEAPTTRTDGTPFDAATELDRYDMFISWNDGAPTIVPVWLVDGAFSETIQVDDIAAGRWAYWFQTVDTDGRRSIDSERVTVDVLGPLADPTPPTGLLLA